MALWRGQRVLVGRGQASGEAGGNGWWGRRSGSSQVKEVRSGGGGSFAHRLSPSNEKILATTLYGGWGSSQHIRD